MHVLVGNSDKDYDNVRSCVAQTRTVRDWVVPKSAAVGDQVVIFFHGAGFVASGKVATKPKASHFGIQAAYRSDIKAIKLSPRPVPLEYVREAIPQWGWLKQVSKSRTTPSASIFTSLVKAIEEYQRPSPSRTFLLTWNLDRFAWKDLGEEIERLRRGATVTNVWSCGVRRDLPPGSEIFLLKLGSVPEEEKGLIGHGTSTTAPVRRRHWSGPGTKSAAQFVGVDFDYLGASPAIALPRLRTLAPSFNWTPQGSGIEVPQPVAEKLRGEWAPSSVTPLPEELELGVSYPEGAARTIRVNAFERSRQARDACVEHHGASCAACGLDFGQKYGQIAKGVIHVHHVVPIASVKHGYQVDPMRDLVPLCPNCHVVAHLKNPPYSVAELRAFIHQDG